MFSQQNLFQEARVNSPRAGMAGTTSLGARTSEIRQGIAGEEFSVCFFIYLKISFPPLSEGEATTTGGEAQALSKTIAPLAASGTALISRPALPEPPSYLSPCPASSSAPRVTCPTDVPASHLRLCPAGAPTPLARLRASPPAAPVPLLISPLARPTPRPPVPRPQQRPGEAEAAVARSLRSCLGTVPPAPTTPRPRAGTAALPRATGPLPAPRARGAPHPRLSGTPARVSPPPWLGGPRACLLVLIPGPAPLPPGCFNSRLLPAVCFFFSPPRLHQRWLCY